MALRKRVHGRIRHGIFGLLLCLVPSPFAAYAQTLNLTPTPTLPLPTPLPTLSLFPSPTAAVTPVLADSTRPLVLDSNFFNPRRAPLGVHFHVDSAGQVRVSVYNMAGEEVADLAEGPRQAGVYGLSWDGRNQEGALVGNGVYLVLLETPSGHTLQKVILLK